MAAPILWAPRKNAFFLQEKPMSIKFLLLGGYFGFRRGGECRFYCYGREDFSEIEKLVHIFGQLVHISGCLSLFQLDQLELDHDLVAQASPPYKGACVLRSKQVLKIWGHYGNRGFTITDLPKMLSDDFSCIMTKLKFVL